MDSQEQTQNHIEDLKREGRKLAQSFYFHWSLLTAGTLTLIVTFLGSMIGKSFVLKNLRYVAIAILLLIISLIHSSLRNLFESNKLQRIHYHELLSKEQYDQIYRGPSEILSEKIYWLYLELLPIASYITALILLFVFVTTNLKQG